MNHVQQLVANIWSKTFWPDIHSNERERVKIGFILQTILNPLTKKRRNQQKNNKKTVSSYYHAFKKIFMLWKITNTLYCKKNICKNRTPPCGCRSAAIAAAAAAAAWGPAAAILAKSHKVKKNWKNFNLKETWRLNF